MRAHLRRASATVRMCHGAALNALGRVRAIRARILNREICAYVDIRLYIYTRNFV